MRRLAFPAIRPLLVAAADGAAILAFTVAGILAHDGALTGTALAEDALPLLAGWFAAALVFRLYVRPSRAALLRTWAVGIPAGVALRAAVLGRLDEPRQLAFLTTTLVLTLACVLGARSLLALASR